MEWITEVSCTTTANSKQIWFFWKDVVHWKIWDKDVETAWLMGDFTSGTQGILKPMGGPQTKFKIIECTEFKSFTSRSNLPLCTMDFIHILKESESETIVTHKIVMHGLFTFLFSRLIGNKIKDGLSISVNNLVKLAEQKTI